MLIDKEDGKDLMRLYWIVGRMPRSWNPLYEEGFYHLLHALDLELELPGVETMIPAADGSEHLGACFWLEGWLIVWSSVPRKQGSTWKFFRPWQKGINRHPRPKKALAKKREGQ